MTDSMNMIFINTDSREKCGISNVSKPLDLQIVGLCLAFTESIFEIVKDENTNSVYLGLKTEQLDSILKKLFEIEERADEAEPEISEGVEALLLLSNILRSIMEDLLYGPSEGNPKPEKPSGPLDEDDYTRFIPKPPKNS